MIEITPSERFLDAVDEWAEARMMEHEEALETKAEQALLEIEHLVSGQHEVEFDVEDDTIQYEPSDEVAAFLAEQSERSGIDEQTVLTLHVNLFANVFLEQDTTRPPNAAPEE